MQTQSGILVLLWFLNLSIGFEKNWISCQVHLILTHLSQILRYSRELEMKSVFADHFHTSAVHLLCVFLLTLAMRLLQLRRERIAERMKALQELVPNANKVDQFSPLSFLFSPLFSFCPFF